MMAVIERIIFVAFYLLILASSHFCGSVIQTYHRNKPLGLQTLHGKIIEDVFVPAWTGMAKAMIAMLILSEIVGPLPKEVALVFQVIDYGCVVIFHLSLFFVMLIKYLSIYHGPLIDSFDEKDVVKAVKTLVGLLPWTLALLEFLFITPMEDTLTFQTKHFGFASQNAKIAKGKLSGIVCNSIMLIVSQGRIEYENIVRNEGYGCLASIKRILTAQEQSRSDDPESVNNEIGLDEANANLSGTGSRLGYSHRFLRIVFVFGMVSILMIIFHVTTGAQYSKYNLLIIASIFAIGGPYLFISNHQGMNKIAKDKITAHFACFMNF